jgi:hypothetical protein
MTIKKNLGGKVMQMLLPNGGWIITENDFDSIIYDDGVTPITKEQFDSAFAAVETWETEQNAAKAHERAALLERLGITEDEARLLLGGN